MATASQIIAFALQQKGKPYVFNTAGPDTFDCSGFIHYVLKSCGVPNTRTSVEGYWTQSTLFDKVSYPIPGHLVFFQNTYKQGPSHMGILINETEFIHASDETTGVIVSKVGNVYWNQHFLGYGKLKAVESGPTTRFIDVPTTHWGYKQIEYMAANGIMNGYGNGYFGEGDGVPREQLAAFLYRILKPADTTANPYGDIGGSSFQKEICALTKLGIFNPDSNGNFNPYRIATRAEMAVVLTKGFNLQIKANYEFVDMTGHWANSFVKAVYSNGVAGGIGDRKYGPDLQVTRAQAAVFLYNAIFVDPNFVPQPI